MSDAPERIWIWFADREDGKADMMRKWQSTPFDLSSEYIRADHAEALVRAAYEAAARRHDELWRETSGYKAAQIRTLTLADAQKVMGEE